MQLVLRGFLFALLLQLSVGPVCLAVISCSAACGTREALKMTGGVTTADALYILAALGGVAGLFDVPWLRNVLVTGGAAVLIWFGCRRLLSVAVREQKQIREGNSYLYGLRLTLANPLTVLFWSGTLGSYLAAGDVSKDGVLPFAFGCIMATPLFLGTLAACGGAVLPRLGRNVLMGLDRFVGLFLIVSGLRLLFR